MVFQSLLTTAVSAMGGSGTGVMGASCLVPASTFNGKEATPVKVRQALDLNLARTFNELPSEASNRRPSEMDEGVGLEEALCSWQSAAEIEPLCRSGRRKQSNYGTFSRRNCLFSSGVEDKLEVFRDKCKAGQEDISDAASRASTCKDEASANFVRHELKGSDTLSSLALMYNVTVNDIIRANGASGMSHNALLVRKFITVPILAAEPENPAASSDTDTDSVMSDADNNSSTN